MKFLTFLIILIIFFNYVIAENELNNSTKLQDKPDSKENTDKHEERYRDKFVQWSHKFSKIYKSEEFANRYSEFKKNMDYIEKWNSGNNSMVLGLNKFADMSNDEFKTIFLGPSKKYTLNNTNYSNNTQTNNPSSRSLLSSSVYPSFDLRDVGAVSAVQNQDQCDCSYAFAAAGVIESARAALYGNPVVPLSEQQLVDCVPNHIGGGCSGGDYIDSLNFVISNKGLSTESSYPFTGLPYKTCKIGFTSAFKSYTTISPISEATMEDAIIDYGPIAVKIDASSTAFQLYQSGIYTPPSCSTTNLNLNALVVGYDSMMVNGVLKKYWIMKTSWGNQFGIAGYVYMLKDEINNINQCGIATHATYVSIV